MAELAKLVEAVVSVSDYKVIPSSSSTSSSDLPQRLRSDDSVKLGLEQFYTIVKSGTEAINDDSCNRLGFQCWNQSQIQSVCSVAVAVASSIRSFSDVKYVESIVMAVVHQSLELALCYLEKSELNVEDFNIQNNMVQLLELVLVGGMDNELELPQFCSADSLVALLSTVSSKGDVSRWRSQDKAIFKLSVAQVRNNRLTTFLNQ